MTDILNTLAVGIGATALTDLWGVVARRAFNIPPPNFCVVGRWLCYMLAGVFRHRSIMAAAPKPAECTVGWIAHYVTGTAFAAVLVLLAPAQWLQDPTLLPALLFGLVTVGFPFFVMQPAFGLGVAASKTPNPLQARGRSLMTHAVFGLGLYVSALGLSLAFPGFRGIGS